MKLKRSLSWPMRSSFFKSSRRDRNPARASTRIQFEGSLKLRSRRARFILSAQDASALGAEVGAFRIQLQSAVDGSEGFVEAAFTSIQRRQPHPVVGIT